MVCSYIKIHVLCKLPVSPSLMCPSLVSPSLVPPSPEPNALALGLVGYLGT